MGKRKDQKAADLVRKIWRTVGHCEHCFKGAQSVQLQGAHIFGTGAYPRLKDDLRNGLCLCATCHRMFTDNPIDFAEWIRQTNHAQHEQALRDKHNGEKRKVDWDDRLFFLKDVLRQIETGELTLEEAKQYEEKE